jgi:protein polybromo-1
MYEDERDLLDHLCDRGDGHIQQTYGGAKTDSYNCKWRNCGRVKKSATPFPKLDRLVRHMKEIHIVKHAVKKVSLDQLQNNP